MKVIYVDDERSAHVNFYYDLKDRPEIESVQFFFTAEEALEYVKEHSVDCAFLDIDLAGDIDGIQLCQRLKALCPRMETVFVTGHDHYARAAYQVGGCAYLSKPYTAEEFEKVMSIVQRLTYVNNHDELIKKPVEKVIYMKTFGNFDLLVDHISVNFKTAKAKELLAYLVEQRGGTVKSSQIFLALWENQEYTAVTSTYVRRTVRSLKNELEELGIEDILVLKRNCYSVDTMKFSCDFYELMEGNVQMAASYNGKYMSQYSWGEMTIPWIERKVDLLMNAEKE